MTHGFIERRSGQRYDRHPFAIGARFPVTNFPDCVEAVHYRHLDIHQHDVVVASENQVDRLFTVLDFLEVIGVLRR